MANSGLVHFAGKNRRWGPNNFLHQNWWIVPPFQEAYEAPSGGTSQPHGVVLERQGFSEKVTDTMLQCRQALSNKLDQFYIDKWSKFCSQNNIDTISPKIHEVFNFFYLLRTEPGKSLGYIDICTARWALSSFLILPGDDNLGKNRFEKQYIKG